MDVPSFLCLQPSHLLKASEHYHSDDYDNSASTYSWDSSRLVQYTYSDKYDNEETQIKYSGKTCKGFFPLWGSIVEDDCYTFLAHPELVGLRSNYLPSQIIEKYEYGTEVSNMAYTMDKHGYLESCIVTTSGEGYEETVIYNFTWE